MKAKAQIESETTETTFWIHADFDGSTGRRIAYYPVFEDAGRIPWDPYDVGMLRVQYDKVKEEKDRLQKEVETLQQQLKAAQACQSDPEPVIELRDVSRKKAKAEIAKFFKKRHGEVIYASDVADELNLSYLLVEEIVKELEDEGKIKRAT
jgi:hypothetical protein